MVECIVSLDQPEGEPRYRVWVGQELFAERQWRWGQDCVLQEQIGITAPPGRYAIQVLTVPGSQGTVSASQWRVVEGAGEVDQAGLLRIRDAHT